MSLSVAIKKRFKGFALDVAFESGGEALGILGASGSGKSMTLKCIAGIETPDEGRIVLNGRVLFDSAKKINLRPQKRRVGYLFQSYALFPNMTVEENIACAIAGSKAEKQSQAAALVARYRLDGLEKRYPAQLSGGQQQRVALARILAYRPEVLLLDEPFSALDAHLKEALQVEMMELLAGYAGDAIMVTHSRDEVYRLCPSLLALEDGRVLEMAATKAMFASPRRVAVARLTGCKNIAPARRLGDGRVAVPGWGCTLTVAGPVPEKLSHIGVRAHYLKPAAPGDENAIPVRLEKQIETPFEWDLLLRSAAGGPEADGMLWWKVPKQKLPATPPGHLAVPPENVLLLTD